jgi:hypothetical protein
MKTLITTIALFIMTLSSSVFGQDKEFTYSKTNLVWDLYQKIIFTSKCTRTEHLYWKKLEELGIQQKTLQGSR